MCVHRRIDCPSLSLLQASVFWSISYYSSPFAFFYLYRKGQCAFKGGRVGGGVKMGRSLASESLPKEREGGSPENGVLDFLFYQERSL